MAIPNMRTDRTIMIQFGSVQKTDKEKVMDDIKKMINQGRLKTLSAPKTSAQNDLNFIEENILPAFLDLYQRWPKGYKLIINSKNFNMTIIKYDCGLFNATGTYSKADNYQKPTVNITSCPDKSTLSINAFTEFDSSFLISSVYHELLHTISNFSVKDGAKMKFLSSMLDKKYNGKLTSIAEKYMQRQTQAENDFHQWKKENEKASKKEKYEAFIAILNKNRCWAQRKIGSYESLESYFNYCYYDPYNVEELLAYGLMNYFGTPEEKDRLREQEFGLYDLIERSAVPYVDVLKT